MKKQVLFSLAAAALLASSCSSDEPVLNGSDSYLRVNGTINEVKSRATDTSFDDNDVIGVSDQNVAYVYGNSGFAAQGEGIKVAETTTLSAYYPYTAELSNNEIEFDVAANQVVDFLFAPAVQVTPENPVANFQFSHMMSKIAFTVVDADNQFSDASLSLTVTNVATTGKFNTSTGAVTADASNGSLTSDITAGTAKSFIVPSFANANTSDITVTVGVSTGEFYVATITPALAAGTQYNYKLTIKKNSPDMGVGGTIDGWQSEDEDIDMDKGEEPYVLAVGDFLLKNGTTIAPSKLDDSNKSEVVGVVYFVGNPQPSVLYSDTYSSEQDILAAEHSNCTKGLAVAIKNANSTSTRFTPQKYNFNTWFNSYENNNKYIGATLNYSNATPSEQMLGYNNTQIIKVCTQEVGGENESGKTGCNDLLGTISTFESENPVNNASGWYIPSSGEFSQMLKNYVKISNSMTLVQGELKQYNEFDTNIKDNFYWTSDMRGGTYEWVSPLISETSSNLYIDKSTSANTGWIRLSIAF